MDDIEVVDHLKRGHGEDAGACPENPGPPPTPQVGDVECCVQGAASLSCRLQHRAHTMID